MTQAAVISLPAFFDRVACGHNALRVPRTVNGDSFSILWLKAECGYSLLGDVDRQTVDSIIRDTGSYSLETPKCYPLNKMPLPEYLDLCYGVAVCRPYAKLATGRCFALNPVAKNESVDTM